MFKNLLNYILELYISIAFFYFKILLNHFWGCKPKLVLLFLSFVYEELVVQNLCREPHSSVTVRRIRKLKSCYYVIAIPQAGIPAPTLTVMQGFKAKKDSFVHLLQSF